MNENKGDTNPMNEAWNEVGKAVNQASELYLKELAAYLGWVQNAQHEMFEQAITATQQFSKMGEAQYEFLAKMQRNLPLFGWIPREAAPSSSPTGTTEKRPGRAT